MNEQWNWFEGIDWASETHYVFVLVELVEVVEMTPLTGLPRRAVDDREDGSSDTPTRRHSPPIVSPCARSTSASRR